MAEGWSLTRGGTARQVVPYSWREHQSSGPLLVAADKISFFTSLVDFWNLKGNPFGKVPEGYRWQKSRLNKY